MIIWSYETDGIAVECQTRDGYREWWVWQIISRDHSGCSFEKLHYHREIR